MTVNNIRLIAATAGGALTTVAAPTLPYAALCTAMVCADVVTAWTLGMRVRRRYGALQTRGAQSGRLQSRHLARTVVTLIKIYALLLLASAVDIVLVGDGTPRTLRFCAGAVCFWQAVSVLENEASCSDASWARIARRWLIDKARRHLG